LIRPSPSAFAVVSAPAPAKHPVSNRDEDNTTGAKTRTGALPGTTDGSTRKLAHDNRFL
jgi:hypothetical protein